MPSENTSDAYSAILYYVRNAGCEEDVLDDLVIELCTSDQLDGINTKPVSEQQEELIYQAETRSSRINNGGFQEQVKFIVDYLGQEEAMSAVTEEVNKAKNYPTP